MKLGRASWPGSEEMYHRGGDRGWHHGHHQSDVPAPRKPHSRPYRGGHHQHRGHANYGQYHDNPCHDRNYTDFEVVGYQEHPYHEYHEGDRSYKEYREHREPAFQRGGRHDSGYHKFSYYRGGYHRGRGEHSHYHNKSPEPQHKKYDCKPAKTHKKENEVRGKIGAPKPFQTVSHNPGRTLVTLTTSSSENESETKSSKSKSPAQQNAKAVAVCENPSQESVKAAVVCEKPSEEYVKPAAVCEKPSQESGKAAAVCEKPLQESGKAAAVYEKPSQESGKAAAVCEKPSQESGKATAFFDKPSQESGKAAAFCEKPSQESAKINNVTKERINQVCDLKTEEAQPACEIKTEIIIETKENERYTTFMNIRQDLLPAEQKPKEEVVPLRVHTGKRAHSDEKEFSLREGQKDAETFVGKKMRRSKELDECKMEETVPLLGGWLDMASDCLVPAGTNEQGNSAPAVECRLSDTAQELRTAFILARKEEIELAFAQDCKTFACVASTLLKKDPSIEAAVTSSLRSSLQDAAGRCVQELSKYIDHYDKVLVDTSNRLQDSNM
ncbi:uncharacterized protein LOC142138903 isoform X2 [Mixophyes fleayi]|uniref:uncharacterized protein LOC142138903 isoform X2 n=1 Tax=Mixophyes fleayi TaxID=3061075 RepID=UPI003F4DAC8C